MLGFGPVATTPLCTLSTELPVWNVTLRAKDKSGAPYEVQDLSTAGNGPGAAGVSA